MTADRDDARRLAGLALLRALIASALFGAALFTTSSGGPEEATRANLFVYLSAAYVTAAAEFIWILFGRAIVPLGFVHAGLEAALAGWLVALTGGVESPFAFLLLVATVLGAIAAGSWGAFTSATLSSVALTAMTLGVPVPGLIVPDHADGRNLTIILATGGGCFATAALATYLTQRLQRAGRALRAREDELRDLGELYLKVAQSLRSGLMTLGPSPLPSQNRLPPSAAGAPTGSVSGPLASATGDSATAILRRELTLGRPGAAPITLLNEPGALILGVDPLGAQGRPLSQIVPELATALDATADGPGRSECVLHTGGRSVLLGYSISPLKGGDGESNGSVVTFQDLTEQRKLEEAVQRQGHLASLGELSAGLAHEIRNPLAALSGAAQMLKVASPPESLDDRKLFEVIQRETAQLETLVSDFLTFARPPAPTLAEGDLAELARSTFEAFQSSEQFGARQLTCEIGDGVRAHFDPGQLRQVLWNLLRNALEATGPSGAIGLQVDALDSAARLTVEDDGPGISPEISARIFEPFFTTKERGTGLGLALVGRIIGAHGGTISVDSAPNGTRFIVRLPAI